MAKQLKVIRLEDDSPAVECPRCGEVIQPEKNPIGLDGYDCAECYQVIDSSILAAYRKALRQFEEGDF
jgi:hypothetical protein